MRAAGCPLSSSAPSPLFWLLPRHFVVTAGVSVGTWPVLLSVRKAAIGTIPLRSLCWCVLLGLQGLQSDLFQLSQLQLAQLRRLGPAFRPYFTLPGPQPHIVPRSLPKEASCLKARAFGGPWADSCPVGFLFVRRMSGIFQWACESWGRWGCGRGAERCVLRHCPLGHFLPLLSSSKILKLTFRKYNSQFTHPFKV